MRYHLLPLLLLVPLPMIDAGEKDIELTLRRRVPYDTPDKKAEYKVETLTRMWTPKKTAIIVCDMWDTHHSYNAVQRVVEIAPRMNEVLEKSRAMGVLIIHAPSSCIDPYKDHPARKNAKDAPAAKNLPKDIGVWCHKIPSEEKGKYPIDQSDGGCDSEPAEQEKHKQALIKRGRNPGSPWKSQIDVLKMYDQDVISDSGSEIWNVLEARGINNVIVLGVHTNMCVLGRPFGLRQMAKNGKNVVLMRDMTDTMYNPKRSPYVNHYKGTELIVEHIEKFVCPTITSDQIIGGKAFKFKADSMKPNGKVEFKGKWDGKFLDSMNRNGQGVYEFGDEKDGRLTVKVSWWQGKKMESMELTGERLGPDALRLAGESEGIFYRYIGDMQKSGLVLHYTAEPKKAGSAHFGVSRLTRQK